MNMSILGKALILAGGIFLVFGVALLIFGKIPLFGKLPGDFVIQKKNFAVYFPLASSILISAVLSAVLIIYNLLRK